MTIVLPKYEKMACAHDKMLSSEASNLFRIYEALKNIIAQFYKNQCRIHHKRGTIILKPHINR